MGRHSLEGMLEVASVDQALVWHLQGNHYPPIHPDFIAPAKQAIELANQGKWDTIITLPNGVDKSVGGIIEGLHLESFLTSEEED